MILFLSHEPKMKRGKKGKLREWAGADAAVSAAVAAAAASAVPRSLCCFPNPLLILDLSTPALS